MSYFGTSCSRSGSSASTFRPGLASSRRIPRPRTSSRRRPGTACSRWTRRTRARRRELAFAADGYRLLRRYYAGGRNWWQAGQEMWRRGVRYVIVEKHTTLQPAQPRGLHLADLDAAHRRPATRPRAATSTRTTASASSSTTRPTTPSTSSIHGSSSCGARPTRERIGRRERDGREISSCDIRQSGLLIAGVRNPRSYGVARYTARLADALAEEQIVVSPRGAADPCRQDALPPGELLARTSRADGPARASTFVVTVHDVVPRTRALAPLYRDARVPASRSERRRDRALELRGRHARERGGPASRATRGDPAPRATAPSD